jgi:hypothetical protein
MVIEQNEQPESCSFIFTQKQVFQNGQACGN